MRRGRSMRRGLAFVFGSLLAIVALGFIAGLASCTTIDESPRLTAQACEDLALQRTAFGLAVGDRVIDRINLIGELRGFACADRVPLGLVESAGELRRVRVAELRSYPR